MPYMWSPTACGSARTRLRLRYIALSGSSVTALSVLFYLSTDDLDRVHYNFVLLQVSDSYVLLLNTEIVSRDVCVEDPKMC